MKVTILDTDDWVGIYVDGKLIDQGRSIRLQDILPKLGIETKTLFHGGDGLAEFDGYCPEKLEEYFECYPPGIG